MTKHAAWLVAALFAGYGVGLAQPAPVIIPIPGGESGVGFDDLRWAPGIRRLIVPAGGTASIVLVEPGDWRLTRLEGLGDPRSYRGGHDDGITSADEGRGCLFACDRSSRRLLVVDAKNGRVGAWAKLSGPPDYARYVEPTNEVWVTEPDDERIEIFRLEGNPPKPIHENFIVVRGGPESLVLDSARGRAYTNLWKGKTLVLTLKNRGTAATWENGCDGSRGLALDLERGFVFVGCAEGAAAVLDAKAGKILGRLRTGNGIDVIDYSPRLRHLYLPGGKSATLGIVSVSAAGELSLLEEVSTARGSHCVAADDSGNAYVCDPAAGRLLVVRDAAAP